MRQASSAPISSRCWPLRAAAVLAVDAVLSERAQAFGDLPGVETLSLDLRDRAALDDAVSQTTQIVHLAAIRPVTAAQQPRAAFDVNVAATYDLIELAAQHDIRKIVFGSSHSVYGSLREPRQDSFREADARGPGLNMYGASKIAVEAYLEAHANAGGSDYLSLRLGTIYGPRVNRDNSLGGIMMDAIDAVRRGEKPVIRWAPEAMHDLVYVDDVARAIIAALESPHTGMSINVTGPPISSTTLFETLVELAGGTRDSIDWQPELRRYQMTSNELLGSTLGPVIQTTIDQGLAAFVAWHDAACIDGHARSPTLKQHHDIAEPRSPDDSQDRIHRRRSHGLGDREPAGRRTTTCGSAIATPKPPPTLCDRARRSRHRLRPSTAPRSSSSAYRARSRSRTSCSDRIPSRRSSLRAAC